MKCKLFTHIFIIAILNAITLYLLYNQQFSFYNFERVFNAYIEKDSINNFYSDFRNNFALFLCIITIITTILSCIRITITSFALHITCKLTHITVPLKTTAFISIIAEYVYPLQTIVKFINFYFYPPETIQELTVIPFSLLSLFNVSTLENWMITPLNQLNIFEILYAIVLIVGLKKSLNIKYSKGSEIVLFGYYSFYFIFLISIAFITMTL